MSEHRSTRTVLAGVIAGALVLGLPALAVTPAAAGPASGGSTDLTATRSSNGLQRTTDSAGNLEALTAKGKAVRGPVTGSPAQQAARQLSYTAGQFKLRPGQLKLTQLRAVNGMTIARYQQTLAGVPVMGGQLVQTLAHDGSLRSATSSLTSARPAKARPGIKASGLANKALKLVAGRATGAARSGLKAASPRLTWIDSGLLSPTGTRGRLRLAYHVAVAPTNLAAHGADVYYDANTGGVVLNLSRDRNLNRVVCDAGNKVGSDEASCQTSEAVRKEGQAPVKSPADVNDAYNLFKATSDYYKPLGIDLTTFIGSKEANGAGGGSKKLRGITRFCDDPSQCPLQNAFWNGYGMSFGQDFAGADDVVGHELTHGVTQYTSDLEYEGQSGAINESMSDIMGELVDQGYNTKADKPSEKWLIGEDLPIGAIRSMKAPTKYQNPDKVTSRYWYPSYATDQDNSAYVHINSGVGNKAAYLSSDGGTFNGYTMRGLGRSKAIKLWWQVENTLTSSAQYSQLYRVLPAACRNLAATPGTGFSTSDCAQIDKVVRATEMNKKPVTGQASSAQRKRAARRGPLN